ncbi:hypothetical protein [Cytobacillus horneckiae]|uniref:hypothetical protein n=1 Tax=Cytobacillus horneckiae TaxID=549687 RepID=UPI003D9A8975
MGAKDKPNGKLTPIEMEMALEEMKKNLPFLIENWKIDAKSMYGRYQALQDAGFNEKQAFEIVKARGANV